MSGVAKTESTGLRVVTGRLTPQAERRPRREPKPKVRAEGPSRAALMLALAYRIERAIEEGEVRDQAEAARRLGVTRARLSQLTDQTLLLLAAQESLLAGSPIGVEPICHGPR